MHMLGHDTDCARALQTARGQTKSGCNMGDLGIPQQCQQPCWQQHGPKVGGVEGAVSEVKLHEWQTGLVGNVVCSCKVAHLAG